MADRFWTHAVWIRVLTLHQHLELRRNWALGRMPQIRILLHYVLCDVFKARTYYLQKELDSLILELGTPSWTTKCGEECCPCPYTAFSISQLPCEPRCGPRPGLAAADPRSCGKTDAAPPPFIPQILYKGPVQCQWEPWMAVHKLLWGIRQVTGSTFGIQRGQLEEGVFMGALGNEIFVSRWNTVTYVRIYFGKTGRTSL